MYNYSHYDDYVNGMILTAGWNDIEVQSPCWFFVLFVFLLYGMELINCLWLKENSFPAVRRRCITSSSTNSDLCSSGRMHTTP